MPRRRKKVVCIGGGTGQSQILRSLSRHPIDVTSIVGVTDNGGHSGSLRKIFGIPQVGDIRNCLASLADDKNLFTQLLKYRFNSGKALEGTSLGNLLVVALMQMKGSLSTAIDSLGKELGVKARILPVSDENTQICAELTSGRIVRGEWEIIGRKPRTRIRRLFHEPEVDCLPQAALALARADLIVFCPGSLQTGTISALLPRGMQTTLRVSPAKKVQICNIMTQPGNSDNFTARHHLELLSRYIGVAPDVFVINTKKPPAQWLKLYRSDDACPVKNDLKKMKDIKVIRGNFLEPEGKDVLTLYRRAGKNLHAGPHFIRHDPEKIGKIIRSLL